MSRRTRRKLYVLVVAVGVGGSAPVWAPPLLAHVSAFRVSEVGVVGTRFVEPHEVVALADVDSSASVWDDPSSWERRVSSHPLVRGARVRRSGLRRLEIRVTEVEPVALVATPVLVPVDARGHVVPLDPAESHLDLPILGGDPRLVDDSVTGPGVRTLLRVLVSLRHGEPAFVGQVSELAPAGEDAVLAFLMDSAACERVLLPVRDPLTALRRVEMALGEHRGGGPVEVADARFDGQVVLRGGGGSG